MLLPFFKSSWGQDGSEMMHMAASCPLQTRGFQAIVTHVIANKSFTISGKKIDTKEITPDLLSNELHEIDGIESNVATGYHAIEFLLWGQDLNGHGQGAGMRAYTDFKVGSDCTGGNCDRRNQYLKAATNLLVSDLEFMRSQWVNGGQARANVMSDANAGIVAILTGMGSLSYGEQAGERMKLGLMLHDPEEEHDCFSDNTHNSHFYDGLGIQNIYHGQYQRLDGTFVRGASLSDLVKGTNQALDQEMTVKLAKTMRALGDLKVAADNGFAYDQMLEVDSSRGEQLIMAAVNGLVSQTKSIEKIVSSMGLDNIAFEGSDSLDNPSAVFN